MTNLGLAVYLPIRVRQRRMNILMAAVAALFKAGPRRRPVCEAVRLPKLPTRRAMFSATAKTRRAATPAAVFGAG